MGIWSCIGTSIEQVGKALYQGQSGIILDSKRLNYGFRSALTGAVEAPVLKGLLDRCQKANMSEQAEYAYMATRQAFEQAGIDEQGRLHLHAQPSPRSGHGAKAVRSTEGRQNNQQERTGRPSDAKAGAPQGTPALQYR